MQPNTSRLPRNALGRARWDNTQVNYWTRGDGRALSFSNILQVFWLNTISTVITPRNLYLQVQPWCRRMAFFHLLTHAQIRICFNTCSGSNSITKITPTSVGYHRLNSPAVLASTTTSHIGYLNRQTNFAWTPLSRVQLRNGSLNKSTLISPSSAILIAKSSVQTNSRHHQQLFRHSSMALLGLAFLHTTDGSRHMPQTRNAV